MVVIERWSVSSHSVMNQASLERKPEASQSERM